MVVARHALYFSSHRIGKCGKIEIISDNDVIWTIEASCRRQLRRWSKHTMAARVVRIVNDGFRISPSGIPSGIITLYYDDGFEAKLPGDIFKEAELLEKYGLVSKGFEAKIRAEWS